MPRLSSKAIAFLAAYERTSANNHKITEKVKDLVQEIVNGTNIDIHTVTARAKTVDSLRKKLRDKGYTTPENDVTDLIGARVIAIFSRDVDKIADVLKTEFHVDENRSIDKRISLEISQFGYRSVHLIVKLKEPRASVLEYKHLKDKWFEIQVRGILEHSWAEIEHEVVYKSGIRYSSEFRRRFAAIAGAIEILDREYTALSKEKFSLISGFKEAYTSGNNWGEPLDAARLCGLLEAVRPKGEGWLLSKARGLEAACVDALKEVEIKTDDDLRNALLGESFRRSEAIYAESQGIPAEEISHPALIGILVGSIDISVLKDVLPVFQEDFHLVEAIQSGES